jgi:serine/threonine-protein kinase HipA
VSGLSVWMHGRHVGALSRRRDELTFAYTPEARELGAGRPLLSVSMPTRPRVYRGRVPHAFFNGLLPEGEARRMIAYDFGVDERDVFGLLGAIGRDCAGALVIIPEGEEPGLEGPPEPVTDAEIAERIRQLRFSPLGVDERIRLSLAGVQEKMLLSRLGDAWALPVDGAPSTHILKPAHQLMVDSIANEAFCMRVARHLDLRVAEVQGCDFDGVGALVVERYDRADPGGGRPVIRLHQEDFCQAHALEPNRKYEEAGGPSLRQCAQTLRQWAPGIIDIERLLDLTTLNVILGNADAHAKNLSLLHESDGQIHLAPAYDLMATTHYPTVSTIPGMFVNGVRDVTATTQQDLTHEAVAWGLAPSRAKERIADLLERAPDAAHRAAAEILPPAGLLDELVARASRM